MFKYFQILTLLWKVQDGVIQRERKKKIVHLVWIQDMMYKIWSKYTRKLPITDLYNNTGNWASPLVPEAENLNFQHSTRFWWIHLCSNICPKKRPGDVWQTSIKQSRNMDVGLPFTLHACINGAAAIWFNYKSMLKIGILACNTTKEFN